MIKMDALFIIAGRTLAIVGLTLLSACINTTVNTTCPPGSDSGPGISCSGNSAIILPANTLVSTIANVVTIPANHTIPNGAVCKVDANTISTKCKVGIPGQPCGFTGGKCRDTYDTVTNIGKCECRCNP